MVSALARSSAGSATSSRPGARNPLIEERASHASSLSWPRTVQRVASTDGDPPRCSAERRYGSMTFEIVSSGLFTLVMMPSRSEEHTSELQSLRHLVCRLLLEKKK